MLNRSTFKTITFILAMLLVFSAAQQVSGKTEDSVAQDSQKNSGAVISAKVDINTADLGALIQVKGIGEKTAQNIINYREKNGLFKNIDELINVKGIGEKSLEKLKPYLIAS